MGLTRVELVTSRLSAVRSNQLSYRPQLTSGDQRENPGGRSAIDPSSARSELKIKRKDVRAAKFEEIGTLLRRVSGFRPYLTATIVAEDYSLERR